MTILGTPAAVLGLVVLLAYVVVAPTWIVEGDNAELSALGALGGVAHPSGYPLYVIWLRAWSWLPAHSPAHAAALATCLLTAIEAVLLQNAARAWGAKPGAATLVAALIVASPVVLRVQSQAEVFALNGVVAAAVLWLAAEAGPVRGDRRVALLALVAGLGLANHLTCAFLAPVGILGVVRGIRESARSRGATIAIGIGALVVGILPYAYLLLAPDTPASWGKLGSLHDLAHHVLRMDYGGPGELSPHGESGVTLANLVALARTLGRAFLWLPIVAVAFAWKARTESRAAWLCWLASFVIAGPLFVARFNLRPVALEAYTVSRFHLLPMVLLAIPIAVGLSTLAERLSKRMIAVVVVAAAGGSFAVSMADVARFHTAAVERSVDNLLETLPPNAIVIGTQDILYFGAIYVQAVERVRPDVTVIFVPHLPLPQYRDQLRAKTGVDLSELATHPTATPSVVVAERMLATGRPVFIDQFQANIAKSFPVYPFGLVFRVLPHGSPLPPIEELFAMNKVLYEKYRFDYAVPGPGDDLAAQAHAQYASVWLVLEQNVTDAEHRAYAQAMLRALAPQ